MFKLIVFSFLLLETVLLADISYYEILGVAKTASTLEIRQAYKKLAVKYHPDKNPDGREQDNFIKITEAYETLKDPNKRHKYDVYGSFPSYTRRYDYRSQAEYNNLYYNGLYHEDPFVDTLSPGSFYNYLQDGLDGFYFINFYSPFCPPCQNLVEHWKKLAEMYKGVVKVAAVNCKYYHNFCYNNMKIGSYPTIVFYPNTKRNYIYYRGDRTIDALDSFVMSYLRNHVYIPVITQARYTDKAIAYVLGSNRIEKDSLIRIAYQLKGLVTLAIVEDEGLRAKLTKDDSTTVLFKFKGTGKEITSTEEKDILKQIVAALPKVELIEPDTLKKIRNKLRSGSKTPWVLYFSTKEINHDRLLLHQMTVTHPDLLFGEIDCDTWSELCVSLQVEEPPSWAVLKQGGAYQRVPKASDVTLAVRATRLHSLSASEFQRILAGDAGTWVLAVVPYKLPWDDILEPFTKASLHFEDSEHISFGIMVCSLTTDKLCREMAPDQPGIMVQIGGSAHHFSGRMHEESLVEFIDLVQDSANMELSEQQVLEILDAGSREHTWLVAFLPPPARCGRLCDELLHEWRLVAKKLRPLEFVRVGCLQCGGSRSGGGFCANVRAPAARLYPYASGHHYSVNLQQLSQAPYMLEWALEYIDDSVLKLNWQTFTRNVLSEELNPSSGKKPWLVYFHSPRCYRCYEMYADFAIAGILLNNAVQLGKVNCINERGLCQHEQINSYPSLRLYLGRNQHHRFSTFMPIQVKDYQSILNEVTPHIRKYDPKLLANLEKSRIHDEF